MYYVSLKDVFAIITIFFIVFETSCGSKDYRITAYKHLPDSSHSNLFSLQTSLTKCVHACALRPWCNVIGYRRRYSLCELFDSLDWQSLESGNSIIITKENIHSQEMDQCKTLCPADGSGQVQPCKLNAGICLETDCASSPSVENGTILGNVYLEGSKLKVACNQGYEPLPGMAISKCENGTWTNALNCGVVCDTGWEQNGNSLYCFTKITGNFTFAKAVCAEIGAEILNVENESEQSYLQGKLHAVFGFVRFVYLGMEKDYNMLWRYSTALEEVTYFNWGPGEPDDFPEELCAVMFGYSPGWQWADISCSRDCRLVCERAI